MPFDIETIDQVFKNHLTKAVLIDNGHYKQRSNNLIELKPLIRVYDNTFN